MSDSKKLEKIYSFARYAKKSDIDHLNIDKLVLMMFFSDEMAFIQSGSKIFFDNYIPLGARCVLPLTSVNCIQHLKNALRDGREPLLTCFSSEEISIIRNAFELYRNVRIICLFERFVRNHGKGGDRKKGLAGWNICLTAKTKHRRSVVWVVRDRTVSPL